MALALVRIVRPGVVLALLAGILAAVYLLLFEAGEDTFHDFWVALVAGVAGAVVWAALALGWRALRFWTELRPSVGEYDVYEKGTEAPRREKVSVTKVRGNVMHVRMTSLGNDGRGVAETGIEMNERALRNGRGLYEHVHPDESAAFGWWDIQIKDADTIYVYTTFARSRTRAFEVEGFIWRRQKAPK
jgi:hypothetical protein